MALTTAERSGVPVRANYDNREPHAAYTGTNPTGLESNPLFCSKMPQFRGFHGRNTGTTGERAARDNAPAFLIALRLSRGSAKGIHPSLQTVPVKCAKSATCDVSGAGRLTAGER